MTDARTIARTALAEITPDATVGDFIGTREEAELITSYLWASAKPGYPDWQWTVTVVALPDAAPSVMELELLPTETSVLAPDWVPWSVRLAEYRAAQQAVAEARAAGEEVDAGVELDDIELVDDDEFADEFEDEFDEFEDAFDDDSDDDDEVTDEGENLEDEEDLDEFGAAEDGIHGVTLPGEEDD